MCGKRQRGAIAVAGGEGTLVAEGPGGLSWRYPVKLSAQGSFNHVFDEANTPTGTYSFHFEHGNETAMRNGQCPEGGVSRAGV